MLINCFPVHEFSTSGNVFNFDHCSCSQLFLHQSDNLVFANLWLGLQRKSIPIFCYCHVLVRVFILLCLNLSPQIQEFSILSVLMVLSLYLGNFFFNFLYFGPFVRFGCIFGNLTRIFQYQSFHTSLVLLRQIIGLKGGMMSLLSKGRFHMQMVMFFVVEKEFIRGKC